MKSRYITKAVLMLSLVSLFTDISSEMLYPIMPMFLNSIGFSVVLIGILEGLAEAISGISKGYFGNLSDLIGRRVPFVRLGYLLSAISKPAMVVFKFPLWIFFARTLDRLGKGIRTGARDALLSSETTIKYKGRVFGFHRTMDTIGAAIGPLLALLFLFFFPGNYRLLFLIAFLPALVAIFLTFFLKEKVKSQNGIKEKVSFFSYLKYWNYSSIEYKKLVSGLLFFTLINSSDIFLLYKMFSISNDDYLIIILYVFYNLVYALFSAPLGILADRIGMKFIITLGYFIFGIVYLAIAFATTTFQFFIIFFLYGIYAAATEGISKAWITNIAKINESATAIGFFTSFQSVFSLIASSLTGIFWAMFGNRIPFIISSISAFCLVLYFSVAFNNKKV